MIEIFQNHEFSSNLRVVGHYLADIIKSQVREPPALKLCTIVPTKLQCPIWGKWKLYRKIPVSASAKAVASTLVMKLQSLECMYLNSLWCRIPDVKEMHCLLLTRVKESTALHCNEQTQKIRRRIITGSCSPIMVTELLLFRDSVIKIARNEGFF